MFDEYLRRWRLTPDGDPIVTHSSRLLPVRRDGAPAMLKIAVEAEEKRGGLLMAWWDGQGAARVLAQDGKALLLERAEGKDSLLDMAVNGRDDEASRIICAVIARLHAPRGPPPPDLIPLARWFQDLAPAAAAHGGILTLCTATSRRLLDSPQDVVVLHGDIHHGNILDFGPRGWLAIDPKDHQARYDLAMAHYAAGRTEAALDELLELFRRDRNWNDQEARKQMVKIFDALGPTHELTVSTRRRLSSLMFS